MTSITPSRQQLHHLIDRRCLMLSATPLRLSTGGLSHFYFDCKAATLEGEGLSLLADAFLEEMATFSEPAQAVGGLTMGADFITAAVIMKAFEKGLPSIHGAIVRKEPKKHGTQSLIENELPKGTSIVVVDDVITTGKATHKACEAFLAAGYKIVGMVALVDRQAGGCQALATAFGVPVRAVFKKDDFPRLLEGASLLDSSKESIGQCLSLQ